MNAALDLLSPRELEIATLLSSGMNKQQIADDLHISLKTVNAHHRFILIKLGIKHASQLADMFGVQPPDIWQPMESAPMDGTPVLIKHRTGVWVASCKCEFWASLPGAYPVSPIAWMPLPTMDATLIRFGLQKSVSQGEQI